MPVSGVFTSCATPAASRPIDAIFSEICSCSSSRTRSVMSSISRIVPTTASSPDAFCSGTAVALTSSRGRRRPVARRPAARGTASRRTGCSRRAARSASTNGASNTSASVRPIAAVARRRRRSSSSARFQRTIRSSASNTTRPSSSDSRMFSLNSRMRPSSSAFRCSCRYSRPFSIAVATWPATAVSSARSSLLNGSSVSLRPSASTAIARPSNTHGTK